MGQDIDGSYFSQADFQEFHSRLRRETARLAQWIKNGDFDRDEESSVGLELESWLVDKDWLPCPRNKEFLTTLNHPLVVPELSKFNIELNATPRRLSDCCLSDMQDELQVLWRKVQEHAKEMGMNALMIGTCPTLRDNMMSIDYLSDNQRYHALNQQVLRLRQNRPLILDIEGREKLRSIHQDIMLEAATTSFQVHLKVPFADLKNYYNLSIATAAPLVAISANSPFLFGHDLWDETRIPIFEQAVKLHEYQLADGSWQNRVSLGNSYVKSSMIEPFLENLDGHPILLPMLLDKSPEWLAHIRLHNGNIWRWVRPIIGLSANGQPHMRIEQRVPPAGPTTTDMIANLAFYVGLVHGLAHKNFIAEQLVSFIDAKENFYAAAQHGLCGRVKWRGKSEINLQELILNELMPAAKDGLALLNLDQDDINFYLDHVLTERIRSGRTGSAWQRSWIAVNGRDFQGLTACYRHLQEKGMPVHEWAV